MEFMVEHFVTLLVQNKIKILRVTVIVQLSRGIKWISIITERAIILKLSLTIIYNVMLSDIFIITSER